MNDISNGKMEPLTQERETCHLKFQKQAGCAQKQNVFCFKSSQGVGFSGIAFLVLHMIRETFSILYQLRARKTSKITLDPEPGFVRGMPLFGSNAEVNN